MQSRTRGVDPPRHEHAAMRSSAEMRFIMKRTLILLITLLSLLFAACGSAASGSIKSENAPTGSESGTSAESVTETATSDSNPAAASSSEITISDVDAGLSVVLTEIKDMVHPGEAGASLKSAQAAADALDFALGTDLNADMIAAMTYAYYDSLHEAAADEFPEQLQLLDDTLNTLRTAEGESLLEDAGISDSSYPWTDEAFERAEAIAHACSN